MSEEIKPATREDRETWARRQFPTRQEMRLHIAGLEAALQALEAKIEGGKRYGAKDETLAQREMRRREEAGEFSGAGPRPTTPHNMVHPPEPRSMSSHASIASLRQMLAKAGGPWTFNYSQVSARFIVRDASGFHIAIIPGRGPEVENRAELISRVPYDYTGLLDEVQGLQRLLLRFITELSKFSDCHPLGVDQGVCTRCDLFAAARLRMGL